MNVECTTCEVRCADWPSPHYTSHGSTRDRRWALSSQAIGHCTEKGQALVETALFSVVALILGFGILTLIPVHRTRTTATAAAYACAQFVSQSPNPNWAAYQAELVAEKTIEADWSGALGAEYTLQVAMPSGPGTIGGCTVSYHPPVLFGGLLGLSTDWSTVTFYSQSEAWKARWR